MVARSAISTVVFNGKHIQVFAGDPFDHLGAAINRARMRRLRSVYERARGGISGSTILLLTQTQFNTFKTNAEQGALTGHAFTCGITVDNNDDVDYLAAGTFDVDFNLLSRNNIDHLAGCYPGSTTRITEYQDTFLFQGAGIYELTAPKTLTKIGSRAAGLADKIGPPTSNGFQQVDIYIQNSGKPAVSFAIANNRPLYVKSIRLAPQAYDWYHGPGHLFR